MLPLQAPSPIHPWPLPFPSASGSSPDPFQSRPMCRCCNPTVSPVWPTPSPHLRVPGRFRVLGARLPALLLVLLPVITLLGDLMAGLGAHAHTHTGGGTVLCANASTFSNEQRAVHPLPHISPHTRNASSYLPLFTPAYQPARHGLQPLAATPTALPPSISALCLTPTHQPMGPMSDIFHPTPPSPSWHATRTPCAPLPLLPHVPHSSLPTLCSSA